MDLTDVISEQFLCFQMLIYLWPRFWANKFSS